VLFDSPPREVQKLGPVAGRTHHRDPERIPCNAEPDHVAKRTYNPLTSARQRDLAKLAELDELGERFSPRKHQRFRRSHEQQGLLGLVDQRLIRHDPVAGQTDQRVVDAVAKGAGTQPPPIHRHHGPADASGPPAARIGARPGMVPFPCRATFHRPVGRLAAGRHATGSARTRRTLAQQPEAPFGAVYPVRPGELMQIDSTILDIAVV
jgi:putative transposase